MNCTNKLRVAFSDPEYAWIGVTIDNGPQSITVNASTYIDSFYQLTSALLGLMEERGEFTVTWHEEPEKTRWKFDRNQRNIVFILSRSTPDEPILRFRGTYAEVCLPFWRALQSLRHRFSETELSRHSMRDFPHAELERLTAQIKSMKQESY